MHLGCVNRDITPPGRTIWNLALVLLVLLPLVFPKISPAQDKQDDVNQPAMLSVDDAVKIALADNRTLKIVSLNLDVNKEKLAADKTRRLPSFNTYVFGSELLSPISYFIPARAVWLLLSRHRAHSLHRTSI